MRLRDIHDKISSGSEGGSGDGSGDSDETLFVEVFEKFSKNGKMGEREFGKFVEELKKIVPELTGISRTKTRAMFYYLAEVNEIDIVRFKEWWSLEDRYALMVEGKRSDLLIKAYNLYKKYSNYFGLIDSDRFQRLIRDLKIKGGVDDFDILDINGDGAIDFREFCSWLRWF